MPGLSHKSIEDGNGDASNSSSNSHTPESADNHAIQMNEDEILMKKHKGRYQQSIDSIQQV